jgi:RHS repeat-associated protein
MRLLQKDQCGIGHPVNPVTGVKFLTGEAELDFTLPGKLPLHWQRSYFSDQHGTEWLGRGWSLPFFSHLKRAGDALLLVDTQGSEICLPLLEPGGYRALHKLGMQVRREANGRYRLTMADGGMHHVFAPLAIDDADPRGEHANLLPLVSVVNQYGDEIRVLYGEGGFPISIYDAVGRVLALHYITLLQADGRSVRRLQRVMLGDEALVSYGYSPEGNLFRVCNAEGELTREYRYCNHILVEHSQPGALVARYEYDHYAPEGRVVRSEDNLGQSWQFRYLPERTEVTDALGRTTRYLFDDSGALVGHIDAAGNTTSREMGARGDPVRIMDAAGRVRLVTYDPRGNMTSLTNADGARVEIQYHPQWQQPTLIRDATGEVTRLEYDDVGNLLRRTDALGHATSYAWDERGHLVGITDAHGRQQHIGYDDRGQMTSHMDCSGQTTRYGWDEWGYLACVTNAAGESTRYRRDRRGRPLEIVRPDGTCECFTYDIHGRLIGHVNALGACTRWERAADGQPVARVDSIGNRVSYEYDTLRRLCALTNENGAQYRFAYDVAGRLVEEQGFDGRLTRYRRDASGLLMEKLELGVQHACVYPDENHPDTLRTTYERSRAGRAIAATISRAHDGRVERCTWRYDMAGRLTEASNDSCRVERSYDALGQMVREVSHVGDQTLELGYEYDALGNHTVTVLPDRRCLNYLYYGPGRVHQINLAGEVICDIERDALHREVERTQGRLVSRYRYDRAGRLVAQQALERLVPEGAGAVLSRTYVHDATGNVLEVGGQTEGTRRYRYDSLGRLIGAGDEAFAFDPAHNRLDGPGDAPVKDNRITESGDIRYTYDVHGNIVVKAKGARTHARFDYSLKHRIERAHITRDAQVQQAEYGYDALGRRVYKKDASGTTLFMWEANRLLGERRAGRTLIYVYGHNSFVPVAQIESRDGAEHSKAEIRYYHTDQVGLPRELTARNGRVQWRAQYEAWGSLCATECYGSLHQPLRFLGQYYDAESGLHYNQHRYYDPDTGRFMTQDPIGLKGGINVYRYAMNPTRWIDPLGLTGVDLWLIGEDVGARSDGIWASSIDFGADHFIIDGHGTPGGGVLDEMDRTISPEQLGDRVRESWTYKKGKTIVLTICNAGKGGDSSFAQRLANNTGENVRASDGTVFPGYDANGVAQATTSGSWLTFTPK